MRAFDRLGPASALTDDIIGRIRRRSGGDDALGARRQAGRFRRLRAAACSSRAAEARSGSRSRSPLAAARAIGALTRGVVALGAERVALVGGAGEALRPYLEPDIAARLSAAAARSRPTARSCSSAASWRRKGKPRNESSRRSAHLRRRTAARRLRARDRRRFDPGAHPASTTAPAAASRSISAAEFSRPASSIGRSTAAAACCSTPSRPWRGSPRSPPRIGAPASPASCRRS